MAIKRKTVYEYDTSPDPSGGLTGAPSSTLPSVQSPYPSDQSIYESFQ